MVRNPTEAEEKIYLAQVTRMLREAASSIEAKVDNARRGVLEAKRYVWENRSGLDPAELAANRVDISLVIDQGEKAAEKLQKLRKLLASPYFGRVDFLAEGDAEETAHYVGVHAFSGEDGRADVVYDWRSPVASLFYDYEVGKAAYASPGGEVKGELLLKRQYKIQEGAMAYMIETSLAIQDDVLQRELSQRSDEKMKNIVATIQQEQNRIIRDEHARELIIQGVAGSGKTSVALHRIAFLLYRHKGTLTSGQIRIVSPNKVFSDYIAGVLPELGEENIPELGMDELAAGLLAGVCECQTFGEQVSALLAGGDAGLAERIRFKSGIDFVRTLEWFAERIAETYFEPTDLEVGGIRVAREDIRTAYHAASALPVEARLDKTAAVIAGEARDEDGDKPSRADAKAIRTKIRRMFRTLRVLEIYKDFYRSLHKPELFRSLGPKKLEHADAFAVAYLKLLLEGSKGYDDVKHLVVDEMQDYTCMQYAVLARLFPCKKTILGDAGQSVQPYVSSALDEIKAIFPQADTVELRKSYRSTAEIIRFARHIRPDSRIEPIERHGPQPRVLGAADAEAELALLRREIADFRAGEHRSLGIVCKTGPQAERLYRSLSENGAGEGLTLLDFASDRYREGVVIAFAHLAKGLEFDQVIVPHADADHYRTPLDRNLLYIACTRAMHRLAVTYAGTACPWLPKAGADF
ncbi:3'-5' exonuclease [Cohnella sp. REN36]|uniref:HelD family protein n=1 Tax=Cohnella sp. REN36 TaxID=2887347 RepID=UPI001D15C050|nr:3'-5' exonuclease [Cohnella sp. REN36]MCC3375190.1 AAA family ATPase [Cohnella sp. REN36]